MLEAQLVGCEHKIAHFLFRHPNGLARNAEHKVFAALFVVARDDGVRENVPLGELLDFELAQVFRPIVDALGCPPFLCAVGDFSV